MSKFCPIVGKKVVYITCQECEDKVCEKRPTITMLPKKENSGQSSNKVPGGIGITNPTQTGKFGPHPSCETCFHKTGESVEQIFGVTHVTRCAVYNRNLINSEEVSWEGCPYHNKDLSQERICMNCKKFLGGGDWGLSCGAHYHKLVNTTSPACEDFDKKDGEIDE